MKAYEVNFDGLVGNTHNYAGLSFGNVASSNNKGRVASPKAAALQGLAKMKALADKGLKQGVLPPHVRPFLPFLRHIGFTGDDAAVLAQAKAHPHYLNAAHSASNMWVANAATVAPSADSADGRVHFTPANLSSMLHRSIEYPQTARALKAIFANPQYFAHHDALQAQIHSDEGAANHTRFCSQYNEKGVHFFVYGQSVYRDEERPQRFPARQTREAFEAIMRLHQLDEAQCVFALQNPAVIDQGVFHNDVISVGNRKVLFTHEQAFADKARVYAELQQKCGGDLAIVEVPSAEVSVADAVNSYLFNSQLVSVAERTVLIAPSNCAETPAVKAYLDALIAGKQPIDDVQYFDVKQSMANGGGPACLRLRVVLTQDELANLSGRVLLDDALYNDLVAWVKRHYRDSLAPEALGDIALLEETRVALAALREILALPDLYPDL
ncbi:MAG: N-succinylarginine dihydrolase [Gammaproteobacteria bacterium]|nr:MAG: N-succinylarginine dihydrolase [Gammaproteobacteria bacterium]